MAAARTQEIARVQNLIDNARKERDQWKENYDKVLASLNNLTDTIKDAVKDSLEGLNIDDTLKQAILDKIENKGNEILEEMKQAPDTSGIQ